ncbi:MAG: DUF898 family protein [Clostridia bacterium]|nr:DUF898 family protein [Clostridia bacterium]
MSKKFELTEEDEKQAIEKEHYIQGLDSENIKEGASSFFDGGLFGYIGWGILAGLLIVLTLGLGTTWAICMMYRYQFRHTAYNGHRLKFKGSGLGLLGNIIKWTFFTVITLGIYGLFVPVKKAKWIISNLYYEDEEYVKGESYFDGNTLQFLGISILSFIINVLSFGLLYPFTVCIKLRWIHKHAFISKKDLEFTGSAVSLWGHYILWTVLSIVTLGIFALWIPILELKWQTKNTHIKTVIDKDYEKDKTIWLVIPLLLITTIILVFSVCRIAQSDTIKTKMKLKSMDIVSTVMTKCDREYISDNIRYDMYKDLKDKYDNKELTFDEYDEYMEKYDLYNVKNPYEKNQIDGPVGGDEQLNLTREDEYISVGGYKISCGTYTGKDALYDIENQKEIPVDIKVIVEKDGITVDGKKQKYSVSGDKISVGGVEILQATGNNKLVYLAQSCPTLEYKGK